MVNVLQLFQPIRSSVPALMVPARGLAWRPARAVLKALSLLRQGPGMSGFRVTYRVWGRCLNPRTLVPGPIT